MGNAIKRCNVAFSYMDNPFTLPSSFIIIGQDEVIARQKCAKWQWTHKGRLEVEPYRMIVCEVAPPGGGWVMAG